jgi:hypothetical protein
MFLKDKTDLFADNQSQEAIFDIAAASAINRGVFPVSNNDIPHDQMIQSVSGNSLNLQPTPQP